MQPIQANNNGSDNFFSPQKKFEDYNPYNSNIDTDKYNQFNIEFNLEIRKFAENSKVEGKNLSDLDLLNKLLCLRNGENAVKNLATEAHKMVEEKFYKFEEEKKDLNKRNVTVENKLNNLNTSEVPRNNSEDEDDYCIKTTFDDETEDFSSDDEISEKSDEKIIELKTPYELESSKRSIFKNTISKIIFIFGAVFTSIGIYVASKPLIGLGTVVIFSVLILKCIAAMNNRKSIQSN